ncbi:MAG: C10 family peptidase, partial [Bacteroidota bacterium]
AQVLNCLMEIKAVQFSDDDDYYHIYAGNHFWIDDDWQDHGFPAFDSLNLYLDTIQNNYLEQKPLNNLQKAALTFACGTALKQVYSSSVSGTWGIEQAIDAYQRFGFEESRLVYDSDTSLCADLAENIKNGWPAHLGLVDPGGTVGHNVVVDGYNTDEFYHFNFGWGGSSNGWYTMPPTSAPYNLTVIDGIVMDIKGINPHVGVPASASKPDGKIKYHPQLNEVSVMSSSPVHDPVLKVYDIHGRLMYSLEPQHVDGTTCRFSLPRIHRKILLITALDGRLIVAKEKIMP